MYIIPVSLCYYVLPCPHYPLRLQPNVSDGTIQWVNAIRPCSRLQSSSTSSTDYCLPWLCTKLSQHACSHAGLSTCNVLPHNICTVADSIEFQKLLNRTILEQLLISIDSFVFSISADW